MATETADLRLPGASDQHGAAFPHAQPLQSAYTGYYGAANSPMNEPGLNLPQILAAVRRRRKPMLWAGCGIALVAFLTALLWPPTYRSTGTILIEQQEIPTEFVRSAVQSYADQRVQVISQRVMTSTNLLQVVEKYDLYPNERDRMTREKLIDTMREDINLRMISAEVMDPRQGRATRATIAFAISFDSRNPQTAARVANELTSLYLSENIETRKQLAGDTAKFLMDESERLARSVAALEQKLADFKSKNSDKLPEYSLVNLQLMDRSESELRDLEMRMRALDQQIVFLDAQLAQINPSGLVYTENGERVLSAADRLKVARSEYAQAVGSYSPDHPDVIRLLRTVESLESQLGVSGTTDASNEIARKLMAKRGELAAAQQSLGAEHPDVARLEGEIGGLQKELRASAARNLPVRTSDAAADNPAFIQLRAQKNAAVNERASLAGQAAQVRVRVNEFMQKQALAPSVERDYSALVRELDSERLKYNEIKNKQMEAQLVSNLETERKGERFTLIEPPVMPQKPVSPNRPAILLLGTVLALGAALGLMFLLETVDTRVRDRAHVTQLLSVPPLAVIPYMELPEEREQRRLLRGKLLLAGGLAFVVLLVLAHFLIAPLDALFFGAWRRMFG